jgi:nitrate/TMAO reductase-like tetraheme cytochrome c subunit
MRIAILCFVAVLVLAESRAGAAALSPREVKEAQKLYNLKCAKCHKFYDPAGYTQPEWDEWMRKMSKKSKLKPAQHDLLSRYLEAMRSEQAK